jgi:hypothetical protein
MPFIRLALAGALAITTPIAGHAAGPGSNMRSATAEPVSNVVLVWDGGGSVGRSGASGGHPGAGRVRQWNGVAGAAHWGQYRPYGARGLYGPPVPTYWVWVPGSAVFDYPFADWRGPTGGWGNP